tara:strand:- start:235 stop:813 length:579 start_codon:yes stop_codon:yes gene_type:complete
VDTLATFLGEKLGEKYFPAGDSPEMAAARAGEAKDLADLAEKARIKMEEEVLKNSYDPLTGLYEEERGNQYRKLYIAAHTPGGTEPVAAEQPVATNGNELIKGSGTFNPQGTQAPDYTIPQKVEDFDVFTSGVDTAPAEPTIAERDAWLRKTRPGDYKRAFSGVTGTAIERDKQLWQLYRDSLNGNRPVFKQ